MPKKAPFNREQGLHYALRLLNQRHYSEYMLTQKLRLHAMSEDDIQAILAQLRSWHLLDDAQYAEAIIRDHSVFRHMSPRLIEQKLRHKGVSPDIIKTGLVAHRDELPSELEQVRYHAARYAKRHKAEAADPRFVQKMAAYLARKGFSATIVYQVTREILRNGPRQESDSVAD